MPRIVLPAPLRDYTEGVSPVAVEGATISDALADLVDRFPRLRRHLFDDAGHLRAFVNVFVDDRDARTLEEGLATAVAEDAMLLIVPSVSGGDGHAIDADSPGIYVQQIEAFIMDASTEEAGWPTRGNCRSTRRNS